ncbi:ABC transporter ATP-binding protein [Brevibacillus massiliensis]|jgi:ABC-2 type transport system ATP-binding protein|uniref:ABC transporter ATP-binding protein n=1 Tax=Brevibacillus massiliensis TaxID=1118054 RepID=UPI0002D6A337|nr:ABC transporter ATP-binding protein [Brevibacillus massiliensis]
MPNQAVVELRNVSKSIGRKQIIKNLSFSVRRGEVYGFLGPNGSGKTMTIRMIVGLISITKGEIYIEGHSIKRERGKALAHVGAIVENPELYQYMSGMKNLIHFARMSETPVSEERIEEIVRLVELEDAIHQKVKTYSLGMRQRLGIAQALLHRPSVLILDEPTNGLDPKGIRQLRDYLRKLAKEEDIAIVVSSHLLPEVELMCDRVVIIQDGEFVAERVLNRSEKAAVDRLPVVFEVDDAGKAAKLLSMYGMVRSDENSVTVEAQKEEVPEIISLFVGNGVKIYQITTLTQSLEDMFLDLTEGGTRS